jgi:hypothetical protein
MTLAVQALDKPLKDQRMASESRVRRHRVRPGSFRERVIQPDSRWLACTADCKGMAVRAACTLVVEEGKRGGEVAVHCGRIAKGQLPDAKAEEGTPAKVGNGAKSSPEGEAAASNP